MSDLIRYIAIFAVTVRIICKKQTEKPKNIRFCQSDGQLLSYPLFYFGINLHRYSGDNHEGEDQEKT